MAHRQRATTGRPTAGAVKKIPTRNNNSGSQRDGQTETLTTRANKALSTAWQKQKDKVHTSTPEGRHFVQAHTKEREKQQN